MSVENPYSFNCRRTFTHRCPRCQSLPPTHQVSSTAGHQGQSIGQLLRPDEFCVEDLQVEPKKSFGWSCEGGWRRSASLLEFIGFSASARVCPLSLHHDSKSAGHPKEISGIAMTAKSMHTHQVDLYLQFAPPFQESLPSTSTTTILASRLRRW